MTDVKRDWTDAEIEKLKREKDFYIHLIIDKNGDGSDRKTVNFVGEYATCLYVYAYLHKTLPFYAKNTNIEFWMENGINGVSSFRQTSIYSGGKGSSLYAIDEAFEYSYQFEEEASNLQYGMEDGCMYFPYTPFQHTQPFPTYVEMLRNAFDFVRYQKERKEVA